MKRILKVNIILYVFLLFISCGSDDKEETLCDCDDKEEIQPVPDPEGTIEKLILIAPYGGHPSSEYLIGETPFYMHNGNGFSSGAVLPANIICVGKVDGLGAIKSIPLSGWKIDEPVKLGYGYITYYKDVYCRFFVDSITYEGSNIVSAVIKYQMPFEPTVLELSQDSLWLGTEGTGHYNRITIDIMTDALNSDYTCEAPWITVYKYGNQITFEVAENKTILGRRGEILIHANERTKRIVVVQDSIRQTSVPYRIGDIYYEKGIKGIVYKISDNGYQGMLVSLDEAYVEWGIDFSYTGCSDSTNGMNNMAVIKQKVSWESRYPAFAWCDGLNTDGVTGWYIPAIGELKELYAGFSGLSEYDVVKGTNSEELLGRYGEARDRFNQALSGNGGVAITYGEMTSMGVWRRNPFYGSSTEHSSTYVPGQRIVEGLIFLDGSFVGGDDAGWQGLNIFNIRAVRAF